MWSQDMHCQWGVLMSYGPPPESNTPPHPQAQQPWTDPHGRGWPGGPPPAEAPKGSRIAVLALILGLAGCVVWALPINLDGIRAYSPLPFAVPGLALAIVALIGNRRGKPAAVFAAFFSVVALALGAFMTFNTLR
jgi:hypothetical protein